MPTYPNTKREPKGPSSIAPFSVSFLSENCRQSRSLEPNYHRNSTMALLYFGGACNEDNEGIVSVGWNVTLIIRTVLARVTADSHLPQIALAFSVESYSILGKFSQHFLLLYVYLLHPYTRRPRCWYH